MQDFELDYFGVTSFLLCVFFFLGILKKHLVWQKSSIIPQPDLNRFNVTKLFFSTFASCIFFCWACERGLLLAAASIPRSYLHTDYFFYLFFFFDKYKFLINILNYNAILCCYYKTIDINFRSVLLNLGEDFFQILVDR